MGMIPIVVVLASVIFLWGMVNYASFVTKKKEIEEASEGLRAVQLQINNLVEQLLGLSQSYGLALPTSLAALPNLSIIQPKALVEALEREMEIVLAKAENLFPGQQTQEVSSLRTALETSKRTYLLARKRYRAALNGYNSEATHMPSKIIARLFGFHPEQSL